MSSLDSDDARSLLITAREEAVRLAELMAAHRDGQMSSDCSDIDEPGACDTCNTLDAAIKAISQLTALRQEKIEMCLRAGRLLGPDFDGASIEDLAKEIIRLRALVPTRTGEAP